MYLHTEVFRIILTTIFRIKPTQAAWIPICYNKIEKKNQQQNKGIHDTRPI